MNVSGFSGTISYCCLRCSRDLPCLLPATIATVFTVSWLSRIMNSAFTGLFEILSYLEMALTFHTAVWTCSCELCMLCVSRLMVVLAGVANNLWLEIKIWTSHLWKTLYGFSIICMHQYSAVIFQKESLFEEQVSPGSRSSWCSFVINTK